MKTPGIVPLLGGLTASLLCTVACADEDPVRLAIERLDSTNPGERLQAQNAIVEAHYTGDIPVDALQELHDELVRLAAIREDAYPVVSAPLIAIELLGFLQVEQGIDVLLERLTDEFPRIIVSITSTPAGVALGRIGAPAIQPILDFAPGASDEEWRTLRCSLESMEDQQAVLAAVEQRLCTENDPRMRDRLETCRERAERGVRRQTPPDYMTFKCLLHGMETNPQPETRHALREKIGRLRACGRISPAERDAAIPKLMEWAQDAAVPGEIGDRPLLAMEVLGELRAEQAVPMLLDRLTIRYARVVHNQSEKYITLAGHALARIGLPAVQPILDRVAAADDDEWRILRAAMHRMEDTAGVRSAIEHHLQTEADPTARARLQRYLTCIP
jgi:HEAT repeat protein